MKFIRGLDIVKSVIILFFISFILGILYNTRLDGLDAYITNFITNISTTNQNVFLINILIVSLIFVLTMSLIGLPIIFFYMFYESFSLGFTSSLFCRCLGFKGLLLYLSFIIVNKLIYILIIIYMTIMGSKCTYKSWYYIIHKEKENLYREVTNSFYRYIIILIIIIINAIFIYFFGNKIVNYIYGLLW